jgi:hypothetical protein
VKAFFGNYTPATGPSMKFSTEKPGLLTDSYHWSGKEEKENMHKKVTKQSLSDYAQQD